MKTASENQLREDIVRLAKSLFDRGYTVGSSGNISVRCENGFLMTPTNSCMGFLDATRLSKLDQDWQHQAGDKPSKEVFLHRAFYKSRPKVGAVVHLHSTFATALSCLKATDPEDCIPPLTPYVVMRVGTVKQVPYTHPGDADAEPLIEAAAKKSAAVLLANHGPVVSGKDLQSAVYAAEELEETAKLVHLLSGHEARHLTKEHCRELKRRFPLA